MSFKSLGIVLFFTFAFDTSFGSRSIHLDRVEDIFMSWKLEGSSIYYPNGGLLDNIASKLPSDFKYKSYQSTVGIWAIVPSSDNHIYVNGTGISNITTASFSFRSSAQLMASVSVRHNLRGKGAKIFIKTSETEKPLYEIFSDPDNPSYEWVNINVPLEGKGSFFVDVEVKDVGDYVLIDRIDGFYVETTTSTLRPKTSTPAPTPLPYSSVSKISVNFFLVCTLFLRAILLS